MQILIAIMLAAQQQPAPPASNDVTVTGPQEQKICRRIGPSNSSATRISRRRVCLTPTQWRERSGVTEDIDEELEVLDEQTRIHSTMPTNGFGPSANAGSLAPR
jgi:hypothetical protein